MARTRKPRRVDPDRPLKLVERALARLERSDTPLTRSNARKELRLEVRKFLAHVDREWPRIATPKGKKAPPRPPSRIYHDLLKDGWKHASLDVVEACAVAGVRVRAVKVEGPHVAPKVLVPAWVAAAEQVRLNDLEQALREGKRSKKARDAFMVEAALAKMGTQE